MGLSDESTSFGLSCSGAKTSLPEVGPVGLEAQKPGLGSLGGTSFPSAGADSREEGWRAGGRFMCTRNRQRHRRSGVTALEQKRPSERLSGRKAPHRGFTHTISHLSVVCGETFLQRLQALAKFFRVGFFLCLWTSQSKHAANLSQVPPSALRRPPSRRQGSSGGGSWTREDVVGKWHMLSNVPCHPFLAKLTRQVSDISVGTRFATCLLVW